MSALSWFTVHPNFSISPDLETVHRNLYSLRGKEVIINTGPDEGRTGLITGICFRSVVVRLHGTHHKEVVLPVHFVDIVDGDHEEIMSFNTPSLSNVNPAQQQMSDVPHALPPPDAQDDISPFMLHSGESTRIQITSPKLTMQEVDEFKLDTTGWRLCQVLFTPHAHSQEVKDASQAISQLIQGQVMRHTHNDDHAYILSSAVNYFDGQHRVGFFLLQAFDRWFLDALHSLPVVKTAFVD